MFNYLTKMKRIRCPKCTEQIQFDETRYSSGAVLVFTCPGCNRQFRLRLGVDSSSKSTYDECPRAMVTVLENDFQEKQVIHMHEGENNIGKFIRGNSGDSSFLTVDPSIDPIHCTLTASRQQNGEWQYFLKDASSNTGTFLNGQLLLPRDNVPLEDGAVVNIGAATIILHIFDNT